MDTQNDSSRRKAALLGSAGLLLGFLLAGVVLTVRLNADWGRIGSVIARNPVLSWGLSVGCMVGGAMLLKQASRHEPPWSPAVSGQRFRRAVLYTRPNCPLCDEASRTLQAYRPFLPPIETRDIESDPTNRNRYQSCVPVLELDGRARFRGHINEVLLRRMIEGTSPIAEHAA